MEKKRVTIRDIAARAGVSISLVSFVMNNCVSADGKRKYRVSDEKRLQILDAARELDYRPNPAARTLRSGRSMVIGVVLSDISNIFYGEIARRLEDIAYQRGYTVLFGSTDENPSKLDRIVRTFIGQQVDGFIIVPCEGSEGSIDRILQSQIPVVVLDRRDLPVEAPTVVIDNVGAMGKAVDLLFGQGARRIDMISYTLRVSSIMEREEGYIRRMRDAGLGEEQIRIHRVPFESIDETVHRMMPEILAGAPEGLVFATNSLTLSAIRDLTRRRLRVQKDIRIVGFDDSEVYSLFSPPISHIQQPVEEICRVSSDELFDLIDGHAEQRRRERILDSRIVEH